MKDTTLTPLVKKNLSDFVVDQLLHYTDELLKQGKTKLPPEVELAQTLSVSRTTIRRALSDLENRGVILRLHGKGTFINPNISQANLNLAATTPLLELIERCGFSASTQTLYHYEGETSMLQQSALRLSVHEMILTICRVYYADGTPVVLLIDYVPTKFIGSGLPDSELERSTFELIRSFSGIVCMRDDIRLSTASPGVLAAYTMGREILQCDSLLAFDSTNYSETGSPVFLSKQFFNTNYISFHLSRSLDVY